MLTQTECNIERSKREANANANLDSFTRSIDDVLVVFTRCVSYSYTRFNNTYDMFVLYMARLTIR